MAHNVHHVVVSGQTPRCHGRAEDLRAHDALRAGDGPDELRPWLYRLTRNRADLPVRRRTALLARELDGRTPEQVAAQLGVSVPAAQMLATRARDNLLKTRAARDADHADIREAPLDAHERGVRPSEHVLRHVKACDACRAYGRDLRRRRRRLGDGERALPLTRGGRVRRRRARG